jgi:hypothetical protein
MIITIFRHLENVITTYTVQKNPEKRWYVVYSKVYLIQFNLCVTFYLKHRSYKIF